MDYTGIRFPFSPNLLFVFGGSQGFSIFVPSFGIATRIAYSASLSANNFNTELDGKSVSWYSGKGADEQLNNGSFTYEYAALGGL